MKGKNKMNQTKAYISNITAMLIFGSIGIFVQYIPLNSSEIVAVRTILGSVFLCTILIIRKNKTDWKQVRKNLIMLIISGIVMGLNWMFLFTAYQYTSVSVATLLYYLAPMIVLFLSPMLLKEKLTWPKMIGMVGSIIGMILVNGTQVGGINPQKGFIYGIMAALFYAGLILLNKKITDVHAVEKTLVQLVSAAIVMSVYVIWTHSGNWYLLQGTSLLALIIIGFVHTGIAYLLYISSMSYLSAQTIALSSYVDPMSALILSAIFLNEHLTMIQILGAILILGGSAFGEFYRMNSKGENK